MKKIPLHPYRTHVLYTRRLAEFKRAYRRLAKQNYVVDRTAAGVTVVIERKTCGDAYLVYARDTSALAHEFGHVILKLFKSVGIDPIESAGEPFCYMLSYLMDEARG